MARAFSYFLHLANIAEDRDQNRRQRAAALADDTPQRGGIRHAIASLKDQGVSAARIRKWLEQAHIALVLTAHPTEVQRKSTLDVHRHIATGLAQGLSLSAAVARGKRFITAAIEQRLMWGKTTALDHRVQVANALAAAETTDQ